MLLLINKSLPEIRRLRANGIEAGELRTPRAFSANQHDLPWALDNDGYQGVNYPMWLKALGRVGNQTGGLFVVAPDVVADAKATARLFYRYAPVIRDCGLPVALAVQDGIGQVGVPWDMLDAVFLAGSSEFKMSTHMARIANQAKDKGKWVHMGRVNTVRRIEYASAIGCDSIDGSKWSRFTDTYMHQLSAIQVQQGMLGDTQEAHE